MYKNILLLVVVFCIVNCTSSEDTSTVTETLTKPDTLPVKKDENPSNRYKAGDKLTAFALTGLTLRDKPDKQGTKLGTVPLGATVTVLANDIFTVPFEVTEKNNIKLKGYWVKINTNEKEGYVFDGFLSKLPVPEKYNELTYLSNWSKKLSTSKTPPPKKAEQDANIFEYELSTFENGVIYEMRGYDGGVTTRISIPKTLATFEEAYLLGKAFYPPANSGSDEYTALEIQQDGANFIIQFAVAD